MKLHNKFAKIAIATASAFFFLVNPLVQASPYAECSMANTGSSTPSTYCYLKQYPWLGLVLDQITYGPISIHDVRLNKGTPLAVVKPGEVIHGQLRYRVDSSDQEAFHRYHLVVGLSGIGAQDCITHTWGLWDSSGKGYFTLKAPLEPGVYEVRFIFDEAPTCEEARSIWNSEMGDPSTFATIGAIIVE